MESLPNDGENNGSTPLHPEPSSGSRIVTKGCGENRGSTPMHPEPLNVAPISFIPCPYPSLPYGSSTSPDINTGSVPVEVDYKYIGSQQPARPLIGSIDIAESEDNYLFRVSLPGVAKHKSHFFCNSGPNGEINIKGVCETGQTMIRKRGMFFKMQSQNLSPPGEFTISFQLPGPIDHQNVNCVFGSDGIFEGIVKKKKTTGPLKGI